MSYGAPGCLSLAGTVLDDLVAEQVMQILAPASLELSIAAEQALRAEREQLERHWQQRLERSRYEVERAARQYAAVEPLCGAQGYVAVRSESRFVTHIQLCGRHITFSADSADLTQNRV